jgi:hypothetical protein
VTPRGTETALAWCGDRASDDMTAMSERRVERPSVRASPETLRVRGWRWQAALFGVLCVEVGVVAVFVGSLLGRGLFNWTAVGLGGALS